MPEKKASLEMSAVDWSIEIEAIAGPYSGNRKSWLAKAARRAGTSFRQIKALYYRETIDPRASVADRIKAAAIEARMKEARRDALQVADLLNRHAQALASVDADFHRNDIDALVTTARVIGGGHSTGDF